MRLRLLSGVVYGTVGLLAVLALPATPSMAATCANPVACENALPGTPVEDWYTPNAWGDIQGFATHESVKPGDTLAFKVSSLASYHITIYRLGWYGGRGARLQPSSPTTTFPAITQPACDADATGLVDCGNWSVTATWTVPANAVTGLYLAYLDQADGNGVMPYPFVVRDESRASDIVVQTSDETWQAYNMYGGRNLYQGDGPAPDGRAYQVSYNRPLDIGGDNGVFGSEYPMIAWLERNGYDVSYVSGIDVSTRSDLLLNHKVYMSSGHDEYWNQAQWNNVTAARAAGVNLAFFSGNEVFWRTRLAPSIDGSNTPNRTLACYKMTKMELYNPDGIADPSGQWTGTWMDPKGAGSGGNSPQNQLTGTLFMANGYRYDAMTVPAQFAKYRLWRNTSIASLTGTQVATFPTGTLGYEWDVDANNSVRPPGAIDLSSTTVNIMDGTLLLDNGNTYGNGTATHSLVEYRDPVSHALVFGAGTVQWSWGLNTLHSGSATNEDTRMQQATLNLLADMGVQPGTRQSNLVAATASTDVTGPGVTIDSPAANSTVPALAQLTLSGTAADVGGQVARVEVSTDGGTTWQAANGRGTWTYDWTPTRIGAATIKVRAVDDSVNTGPVATLSLTVGPQQCPCTVFPASGAPGQVDAGDFSSVELGVRFRTTTAASVTGIKFYKSTLNTGTHLGRVWTANGQLLASGTFSNETASGWQTLAFPSPVPVKANTTYIASYFAPNGHYAADSGYFTSDGAGLAPVQALPSGTDGGDGVYHYGSTGGFPSQTYNDTNYWVDVVVDTTGASTTPPTITSVSPADAATGVAITAPVTATFSEGIDTTSLQFTLTDANDHVVPGRISYDPTTRTATLQPTGQLALGASYTASIQATDLWGNAMTAPYTWSFTTSATPPAITCPCSLWNDATLPETANSPDTNAIELGTRFTSAVDGYVTGVRFYKGTGNTGAHTGSLWSDTGTLLATGTFANESTSGWQSLTFASPVAITANTTYVVSYYAPTGQYAADSGYFSAAYTNYPLTALATGNGVYHYGAEATPTFPSDSYNSTNYWVDPIITTSAPVSSPSGTTAPGSSDPSAATTGPTALTEPAADLNGSIPSLSVKFPAPVDPASVTMTVVADTPVAEADEGVAVPGSVTYDPASRTATFRPAGPLVPLAGYEVTARGIDLHGRPLDAAAWIYQAPGRAVTITPPEAPVPASPSWLLIPQTGTMSRRSVPDTFAT